MRWREVAAYVWLVAIIVALAGFAWMTRNPTAEVVERATHWPLIGRLATHFRRAYLPEPSSPATASSGLPEGLVPEPPRPQPLTEERFGARPQIWIGAGTELRQYPDHDSAILETTGVLGNLPLISSRGDWYKVRVARLDRPPFVAWVFLEDYEEPTAEALREPEPVLPLPAVTVDPQSIALAGELMIAGGEHQNCGAYPLFTDAASHPIVAVCGNLTAEVEETYRRRYHAQPIGAPAETILLFSTAVRYHSFKEKEGVRPEARLAYASPARGYVALFAGDRSLGDIAENLVHELVHLLNRRALGPALPPWLDEGLAADMAHLRIDASGVIDPTRLGGQETTEGSRIDRTGGVAAMINLQQAQQRGELPSLAQLLAMDRELFHRDDRAALHYAASAAWIRFLLSDFDVTLAGSFHFFLGQVAAGKPLTNELVHSCLDREWSELESSFGTWLRLQVLTPLDEIGNGAG